MTECIDIDKIIVGERDRQEFGDIIGLAESIDELGLLHPVVVTADHQLVAGGRRLEACKQLGWMEVPVTIVDLANAEEVLQAEQDENTCRKGLTPYEASRARERRAKLLAPMAAERQAATQAKPGEGVVGSSNLDEPETPKLPSEKATRKVAAKGTGYSGSTLDKVDKIRDTAERGVIRQGKTEIPAPAPVVEVAKKSLEAVKQTGVAVDRASRDYQTAVDEYVNSGADVQLAKFRKNLTVATKHLLDVTVYADHAEVAAALTPDQWESFTGCFEQANRWWERVKSHRQSGLRAVGGTGV